MDTLISNEEINVLHKVREDVYRSVNTGTRNFISETFQGFGPGFEDFYWIDSSEPIDAQDIDLYSFAGIGNICRLNNIRRINKFLESANRKLQVGDYMVVCAETKDSRRIRILNKFPKIISRPYYVLDFILKRVFPKWRPTRKIYFSITKGLNRVISFTEVMGRLYSCGFKAINHVRIGYLTYFVVQKIDKPAYNMEPTYGTFVKLNRVGKDGEMIQVYKMRTMHPYSEYIQDYVFEKNNLQNGGKFHDDFRVTSWGKWFRKLWIDELPMLINWVKGEMKLVGVRPLSNHYFSLYPEEMQGLRTKVKPGLVPPFYADLPDSLEDIIESERRYIESYLNKPLRTDIRYFFKAMYNIFFKKALSA